jgi:hypothetical protein
MMPMVGPLVQYSGRARLAGSDRETGFWESARPAPVGASATLMAPKMLHGLRQLEARFFGRGAVC